MFNLKVLFFISCLIIAATAQTRVGPATDVTGQQKDADVDRLKQELGNFPSGAGYTVGNIDKVAEQQLTDGVEYMYQGTLFDKDNAEKQCSVDMVWRPTVDNGSQLNIKCK